MHKKGDILWKQGTMIPQAPKATKNTRNKPQTIILRSHMSKEILVENWVGSGARIKRRRQLHLH